MKKIIVIIISILMIVSFAIGVSAEECQHDTIGYSSVSETEHIRYCEICGEQFETGSHTYENGRCTLCCAYETTAHCEHVTASVVITPEQHYWDCNLCGEIFGAESHNFVNGVCTICGYVDECQHYGTMVYTNAGEGYHTPSCSNCDTLFENEPHTYSSSVCTKCYYRCTHTNYNYSVSINETKHIKSCFDCDYTIEENHLYNRYTNVNGRCANVCSCGKIEYTEHNYEAVLSQNVNDVLQLSRFIENNIDSESYDLKVNLAQCINCGCRHYELDPISKPKFLVLTSFEQTISINELISNRQIGVIYTNDTKENINVKLTVNFTNKQKRLEKSYDYTSVAIPAGSTWVYNVGNGGYYIYNANPTVQVIDFSSLQWKYGTSVGYLYCEPFTTSIDFNAHNSFLSGDLSHYGYPAVQDILGAVGHSYIYFGNTQPIQFRNSNYTSKTSFEIDLLTYPLRLNVYVPGIENVSSGTDDTVLQKVRRSLLLINTNTSPSAPSSGSDSSEGYADGYSRGYMDAVGDVVSDNPVQGLFQGMWSGVLSLFTILSAGVSIGGISLFSFITSVLLILIAFALIKLVFKK